VGGAGAVIPPAQSLISAQPASIAYACTSGSFVNGVEGEADLCKVIYNTTGALAATTSGALLAALRQLNITRLAIATPYNAELTRALVAFLDTAGIEVIQAGYLDSEHDIMHIDYDSVRRMADSIDCDQAQALFFSCTNLRTYDVIEELERRHNKPVLSANQVTIWAALKAGGLPMPANNQRLFQ
jgi:maleate isomerase